MIPPDSITTERLLLRFPVIEDAEAIFQEYAQDREVTRYLLWRPHQSLNDTMEFLTKCFFVLREKIAYPYGITLRETGKLIGMIELRIDAPRADLGFVLSRSYWNRGYMTEAVKALVSWALDQKDIFRVWARCDIENAASTRVLEKCGMEREGILRRWAVLPNISSEPRDCYTYAKVK